MYQMYDIEIAKETLATLSYIALECGFKFSNKQQFDNIMYRLYNYVKDDIDFDNGIVITSNLKSKINEFKDIYETLPAPDISTEDTLLYIAPQGTAQVDEMPTGHEHKDELSAFIPYKFKLGTIGTGTIYVKAGVKKTEDGDETLVSIAVSSGAIPENTAYFKVSVYIHTSTQYGARITYMSEDGLELGTAVRGGSSTYRPTTYPYIKVSQVYSAFTEVSVYKESIYDFTIDASNLTNIDGNKINEGDKYYGRELLEINPERQIGKYAVLGKELNGVSTDREYEFIKDLSNETLTYDNNKIKFISILKEQDGSNYLAIASSYPLYYTDVNGEDGMWGINTSDITPIKLFESTDGVLWDEITSSFNSNTYQNGAIEVKTYPIWKTGFKLIYNNYPVYYSYVDYTTLLSQIDGIGYTEDELDDALDFMEEYPIEILKNERASNGTLLALFRQSDENFTISMIPPGGAFHLGRHKIEDSPTFPLIWKVLDYSNNHNSYIKEVKYPTNSVIAQTYHAIDSLPLIPKANYSVAALQNENLPFYRWLNSNNQEWFEQLAENDLPVDETNCGEDAYIHRFGFLYNWSKADVKVLKEMTFDGHTNKKVCSMSYLEGRGSNLTQTFKLYRAFPNTIWIDRPYFVKEILFHKNQSITSGAGDIQDDFTVTKFNLNYWKRDYANTGRYVNGTTSSGTYAYLNNPVCPIICIDENTVVNKDSMSKGVFILNTQSSLEVIEVDKFLNTERVAVITAETIGKTKLDIRANIVKKFNTIRTLGVAGIFVAKTERQIRSAVDKAMSLARDIRNDVSKLFKTERKANFIYIFKFGSKRDIVKDFVSKPTPTERRIVQNLVINKTFETVRNVFMNSNRLYRKLTRKLSVNDIINLKTKRDIRSNVNFKKTTLRKLVYGETYSFDSLRDIRMNKNKVYKSKRSITAEYLSQPYPTERTVSKLQSFMFGSSRDIRVNTRKIYRHVIRDLRVLADEKYYTERILGSRVIKIAKTKRILHNTVLKEHSLARYVLEKKDKRYRTIREAIVKEIFESSIIRNIVQSIEFKTRLERYITETYGNDYQAMREVVADMEKISEAMRNVVANEDISYEEATRDVRANAQEDFGTKRIITVPEDENKFVSKKNLFVYTHLLKQEIAVYIDNRIEQAFTDRGL